MDGKRESRWSLNLSAMGVTVGVERKKTREFQPSWTQGEVFKAFRSRFSSVVRDVVASEYDRAVVLDKALVAHDERFRQRLAEAIVAHLGEELERMEKEGD